MLLLSLHQLEFLQLNLREFFIISLSTDHNSLNSNTEAPRISSLSSPFLLFRLVSREREFRERNGDDVDDEDDANGRNFVELVFIGSVVRVYMCVREWVVPGPFAVTGNLTAPLIRSEPRIYVVRGLPNLYATRNQDFCIFPLVTLLSCIFS